MKIKISGYILLAAVIVVSVTTWQIKDKKAPAKDLSEALAEWWKNPDIEQAPCLTERLGSIVLLNSPSEMYEFKLSKNCMYNLRRLSSKNNEREWFELDLYEPGLISKKVFIDKYLSESDEKDQFKELSQYRIILRVKSISKKEFINLQKEMIFAGSNEIYQDNEFTILKGFSSSKVYLFPIDRKDVYLSCAGDRGRCTIYGVFNSKFRYEISIDGNRRIHWKYYNNLAQKIFNKTLVN